MAASLPFPKIQVVSPSVHLYTPAVVAAQILSLQDHLPCLYKSARPQSHYIKSALEILPIPFDFVDIWRQQLIDQCRYFLPEKIIYLY